VHTPTSLTAIEQDYVDEIKAPVSIDISTSALFYAASDKVLLSSSLIQWLITRCQSAFTQDRVVVGDESSAELILAKLIANPIGAVIAVQEPGRLLGISRKSAASARKQFLTVQSAWPDLALTNMASLYCIDSHSQGLPNQIYASSGNDSIGSWSTFRELIRKLLQSVCGEENLNDLVLEHLDAISTIVYELFKNTDDHAKTDARGSTIENSIRGIYCEYYSRETLKSVTSSQFSDLNRAEQYVHGLLQEDQHKGRRHHRLDGLLEFSIFDSGDGFASKWLGCDANLESLELQMQAVVSCLGKGRTSSIGSARGFGLWTVLSELKLLKGFFRVRTNRIHAFRQFNSHRHYGNDSSDSSPKEMLYDWRKGISPQPSMNGSVSGTLVSVLIPVGDI